MKKLLTIIALGAIAVSSHAASFTFSTGKGEFELDHYYAYSWGINGTSANTLRSSLLTGGQQITSAKLTISDIWDWTVEKDILYINLLDDPTKNIKKYYDNQATSNYFSPTGSFLTSWSDPKGGNTSNKSFDFVYDFSLANIGLLTSYIVDPTASNKAAFGFGFDPDCHYFNNGIKFEVVTAPKRVPEGAATVGLMGFALLGLAVFRRYVRR